MTSTETTYTIRTRSTHPFALVTLDRSGEADRMGIRRIVGIRLAGYAASDGARVTARAQRLRAMVRPITDGQVTVTISDGRVIG